MFGHRIKLRPLTLFRFMSNLASVSEIKVISQLDVDKFSDLTGDHNPIHRSDHPNGKRLVHGALLNGLVSGVVATYLPGPGTIIVSQEFSFPHKCVVDRNIQINVRLIENRKIMRIAYDCIQDGQIVMVGTARLMAERKTN